jgi:neutral ceramidase
MGGVWVDAPDEWGDTPPPAPTPKGAGTTMSEPLLDSPTPRRWPWKLALALTAMLLVLGPWPVDDSSFEGSEYQRRTLDRLDAAPKPPLPGPIRVGLAEVDLTPKVPRPLAGFIGQVRTPFVGVDSPCLARALTVKSRSGVLTILTADLLLINAKLAKATCERAGVRLDQVYFTASHTHGGPGGWGDHPLEMLVAGAYDPAYFNDLADQLADVIKRSRTRLEPAELGFVQVQTKDRQSNRVIKGSTTHDALSALVFRLAGSPEGSSPLAMLVVFGAHATVSHPVPPRLGGDYPAALVSELKRRTGARSVLFASGAVGDASPSRPKAASQAKSAEALGSNLADDLMAALPSARFERDVVVDNIRLDVDLPPVRLPFVTRWLRFSPLATWWIADRRTHLHAVRLGQAALVGFPGDYSGHLADRLVDSTQGDGLASVATSFDGDFRGYLVSEPVFRDVSCYETRWMSFYGPWVGEYLNDLARRMVSRLADRPSELSGLPPSVPDLAPRFALGALLIASIVVGWRHRSEGRAMAGRVGFATVAIALAALLAFEVAPDAVAWASFGLPDWVRMLGAPLGAYALILARVRPSRAVLLFVAACGLLSASWVVVLMIARGVAKAGLNDRPRLARPAIAAG